MCEHCTPFTAVNQFSSQQDFGDFSERLKTACIDEIFIRIVNADEKRSTRLEETYQCTFCETDWLLSVHTRSWHGSFLPAETGVTLFEENQTNESTNSFETFQSKTFQGKSNNNCGCCLFLILLLLGSIIYGLYSLVSFLFNLLF